MINADENVLEFFDRDHKSEIIFEDKLSTEILNSSLRGKRLKIVILRHIWFFHAEQQGVRLDKLREFYTEKSIVLLERDGYIKICSQDEEKIKGCNIQK